MAVVRHKPEKGRTILRNLIPMWKTGIQSILLERKCHQRTIDIYDVENTPTPAIPKVLTSERKESF